jgi:hypothetical protein
MGTSTLAHDHKRPADHNWPGATLPMWHGYGKIRSEIKRAMLLPEFYNGLRDLRIISFYGILCDTVIGAVS